MQAVTYLSPGLPESLFEAMAHVIGAELSFERERSGPEPGEDPFADGRYDLGWICSTSFVDVHRRSRLATGDPSIRLVGVAWVPDDPASGDRPVYFGDLVVAADSSARSLAELAGSRIGCNDPVSLSGHHALRHAITRSGADPASFAELVFTGGHRRSLERLVLGELDAAVIDSVVRRARAVADPDVARLRVIDRLGPWPVQPLVARVGLDDRVVERIAERLFAAAEEGPLANELARAGLTRLAAVEPSDFDEVRTMMATESGHRWAGGVRQFGFPTEENR